MRLKSKEPPWKLEILTYKRLIVRPAGFGSQKRNSIFHKGNENSMESGHAIHSGESEVSCREVSFEGANWFCEQEESKFSCGQVHSNETKTAGKREKSVGPLTEDRQSRFLLFLVSVILRMAMVCLFLFLFSLYWFFFFRSVPLFF